MASKRRSPRAKVGGRAARPGTSHDREDELEVVHAVSAIVRSPLEVDGILQRALAVVAAATRAQAGEIWLLEPRDGSLRLAVLHGGTPVFRDRERLGTGEGLPGLALARSTELFVPDLTREPAFVRRRVVDEGFVSFGVVPMQARTGFTGALAVASRDAAGVSERYARLLSQVAGELAILLDNHRLRKELRDARELLHGAAAREAAVRAVYDEVIQSLFGIGLRLQAALDAPAEPLAGTIQEIQAVIADARSLVMRMEGNPLPGADGRLHRLDSVLGVGPRGGSESQHIE